MNGIHRREPADPTETPAHDAVKRDIAKVFGVDPALIEPTAEEIEARRRYEAYRTALPFRMNSIAAQITAQAHRDGWLPENARLIYAPTAMSAAEALARTNAAVRARCTCQPGPRSTMEQHDPDCSLLKTGYLS